MAPCFSTNCRAWESRLRKCVFGIEHFLDVEGSVFDCRRQPSAIVFTQVTRSPLKDFSEHVVLLVHLYEGLAYDALEARCVTRQTTEAVMHEGELSDAFSNRREHREEQVGGIAGVDEVGSNPVHGAFLVNVLLEASGDQRLV